MATVANLAVSVTAKVNKFIAGFKRAQKQLKAFASAVARVAKRVAVLGTAMVAVGVAIAGFKIRKAMKELDLLAKTADALGIVPERLQEMELAANIAGATFEDLAKGMIYLQRRTAEVASGYGEAQTAFKMLGLDAQKMMQMAPEKQWAAFAEGIRGMTTQSKALRAVMDVLGRSGMKLMNLLRMSNAEFERIQERAKRMGILFSREELALVEQANDAITYLVATLGKLWRLVAVELSPPLQAIADQLTEMASGGEAFGKQMTAALEGVARAAALTVQALIEIPLTMLKIQRRMTRLQIEALGPARVAGVHARLMRMMIPGAVGGVLAAPGEALYEKAIGPLQRLEDAYISQSLAIEEWKRKTDSAAIVAKRFADIWATAAEKAQSQWTPAWVAMLQPLFDMQEAMDAAALTLHTKFGKEIDAILARLKRMAETAGKTAGEIALMDLAARNASESEKALAREYIETTRQQKLQLAAERTGGQLVRFAEVSLSRQAVMGLNVRGLGGQLVRDPQLQETNRLLGQVAVNTRSIHGVL